MHRLVLGFFVSALLFTVACTGGAPPPLPPPFAVGVIGTEGADPPQLVTEEYLRRQLDIRIAQVWALPIAEALAGPAHRAPSRIVGVNADSWAQDKQVKLVVVFNDGPGQQRHVPMTFTFNGPNYDTTAGSVTTGVCHKLPNAGVQTTGEFTTVENDTGTPDEHHIEKTVEESTASSTTLSMSLELMSGVTVEGGSPIGGSVSATLESTFGISKESTEEHSKTTSVTVSDDIEVPGGKTYAIAFTTDNSATDCNVSINAEADWSDIKVVIEFPVELRPAYHKSHEHWSSLCYNQPTPYSNLCQLLRGTAVDDGKWRATIGFNQGDQVYRLLMGYDVRCPHCNGLIFSTAARSALAKMADPSVRWISFDGVRHSTSKADASYKALDVTGLDADCVADKFGAKGKPVDTLDDCA